MMLRKTKKKGGELNDKATKPTYKTKEVWKNISFCYLCVVIKLSTGEITSI